MRNKEGFTLIELVMVIVILGILAAVALPKFVNLSTDAKEAASKGCLGGIRAGVSIQAAVIAARSYSGGNYPTLAEMNANAMNRNSGNYTSKILDGDICENPNNNLTTFLQGSSPLVSGDRDDTTGFLYDAATGEVRLNTTGNDSSSASWFTY